MRKTHISVVHRHRHRHRHHDRHRHHHHRPASLRRALSAALLLFALVLPSAAWSADGEAGAANALGQVNVNTATAEQLKLLPRVGPALAKRILELREANGKFESVEDLLLVRGIGEKTFAMLRPYVKLEGETTLKQKLRPSELPRPQDDG